MEHMALSLRNRKRRKLPTNSSPIILLTVGSMIFGFWLCLAMLFLVGLYNDLKYSLCDKVTKKLINKL